MQMVNCRETSAPGVFLPGQFERFLKHGRQRIQFSALRRHALLEVLQPFGNILPGICIACRQNFRCFLLKPCIGEVRQGGLPAVFALSHEQMAERQHTGPDPQLPQLTDRLKKLREKQVHFRTGQAFRQNLRGDRNPFLFHEGSHQSILKGGILHADSGGLHVQQCILYLHGMGFHSGGCLLRGAGGFMPAESTGFAFFPVPPVLGQLTAHHLPSPRFLPFHGSARIQCHDLSRNIDAAARPVRRQE